MRQHDPVGAIHETLLKLERMPAFLEKSFMALSPGETVLPGPNGLFSPVEQCWHLADLEREGFGERIRRLLAEEDPLLPDFDGDRVARERQYRSLSIARGARAFHEARGANLTLLRSISTTDWNRRGRQEGLGDIVLGDLPAMMAAHDASHTAEIEAWLREHPAKGCPDA